MAIGFLATADVKKIGDFKKFKKLIFLIISDEISTLKLFISA
jgi:hypothetical protein